MPVGRIIGSKCARCITLEDEATRRGQDATIDWHRVRDTPALLASDRIPGRKPAFWLHPLRCGTKCIISP